MLAPSATSNSQEQKAQLAQVDVELERHVSAFTFKPVIGDFFATKRLSKATWFFHRVLQDSVGVVDVGRITGSGRGHT